MEFVLRHAIPATDRDEINCSLRTVVPLIGEKNLSKWAGRLLLGANPDALQPHFVFEPLLANQAGLQVLTNLVHIRI